MVRYLCALLGALGITLAVATGPAQAQAVTLVPDQANGSGDLWNGVPAGQPLHAYLDELTTPSTTTDFVHDYDNVATDVSQLDVRLSDLPAGSTGTFNVVASVWITAPGEQEGTRLMLRQANDPVTFSAHDLRMAVPWSGGTPQTLSAGGLTVAEVNNLAVRVWEDPNRNNTEVYAVRAQAIRDVVAPDVHLDGGLYEDRATELVPDLYDLAIEARDDAGVTEVRVLVDGALAHVAGPDQPCDGSACDVDTDFDLDANGSTGTHSFEVRATDAAGNVRSIAWTASFNRAPFPIDDLLNQGLDSGRAALPAASGDGAGCGFIKGPDAGFLTRDRPTAIVNGHWNDARGAGRETTEHFGDREYRVTRCRPDGTLVISQLVGPVSVPGGIALLELGRTVPQGDDFGTSTVDYASPTDPVFVRAWARGRARALANTIPPTKP